VAHFLSVSEYLSGTTENVLVITPNATMASDLRVFSSDGNSTMRRFANLFFFLFHNEANFGTTVLLILTLSSRSAKPCLAACLIPLHRM